MPKIVILEAHNTNPGDQSWVEVQALGDVTIHNRTTQEQLVERAQDADILLTNKLKVTRQVMEALPKLKLVHQLATGTDNIDKVAAQEFGIKVGNAVGYSSQAVAQHTFALILELVNHVSPHHKEAQSGSWSDSGDWCHMLKSPIELAGKKLGIIGYGRIGQAVAKLGMGFGMKIWVTSSHASESEYPEINVCSLDHLAETCDVISIHSPLTDNNQNMIDQSFLSKMKSTAFLINTARGGHVNEEDLANALQNKMIAGAGLDVLKQEPPAKDNPLLHLNNCIVTPHIAWTAHESRKRLITIVANNVRQFISDHPEL